MTKHTDGHAKPTDQLYVSGERIVPAWLVA